MVKEFKKTKENVDLLEDRGGFSLIEIIIYTVLVAVIATAATTLFISYRDVQTKNRTLEEVNYNTRLAITRIIQEIQGAKDINVASSVFGSNPGKLVLTMADPAVDPTEFDVSAGVLRIKQGTGSPQALTTNSITVTNLVFTNLTVANKVKNIKVSLSLNHKNPAGDPRFEASATLESAASLRKE